MEWRDGLVCPARICRFFADVAENVKFLVKDAKIVSSRPIAASAHSLVTEVSQTVSGRVGVRYNVFL